MIEALNEEVAIIGFNNVWSFILAVIVFMMITSVIIGSIIFEIYDIVRGIAGRVNDGRKI